MKFKINNGNKYVSIDGGTTWENFNSGADLLWTNPAPNNIFPVGEKININLSGYKYALICTLNYYTDYPKLGITTCCVKIGESVTYSPINSRTVKFETTELSITKSEVDSSSASVGNNYFIPYKIYGTNMDLRFINREPVF